MTTGVRKGHDSLLGRSGPPPSDFQEKASGSVGWKAMNLKKEKKNQSKEKKKYNLLVRGGMVPESC